MEKTNYEYLTELVIVLNLKCWKHYEENNYELAKLYSEYYYITHNYALDNLKNNELDY